MTINPSSVRIFQNGSVGTALSGKVGGCYHLEDLIPGLAELDDVTEHLQYWLPRADRPIILPNGVVRVSGGVTCDGNVGGGLHGWSMADRLSTQGGSAGSKLQWVGNDSTALLTLNGCRYMQFEGFEVMCPANLATFVETRSISGSISTSHAFRDIYITGSNGFACTDVFNLTATGGENANNDAFLFERVYAYCLGTGFRFDHAQSTVHQLVHCSVGGGQYGVDAANGASFSVSGGSSIGCSAADFRIGGSAQTIVISHFASENSARFLITPAVPNAGSRVVVVGGSYNGATLHADGKAVDTDNISPVFIGTRFLNATSKALQIDVSQNVGGTAPADFVMQNCLIETNLANPFSDMQPQGEGNRVTSATASWPVPNASGSISTSVGAGSSQTIASGAINWTGSYRINVDTQSAASQDDLDTIAVTGAPISVGTRVEIRAANTSRLVTARDTGGGTGNLRLNNARSCGVLEAQDALILEWDGTNFQEVDRRHRYDYDRTTMTTAIGTGFTINAYNNVHSISVPPGTWEVAAHLTGANGAAYAVGGTYFFLSLESGAPTGGAVNGDNQTEAPGPTAAAGAFWYATRTLTNDTNANITVYAKLYVNAVPTANGYTAWMSYRRTG